jgi:hypothetical protein
VQVQAVRHVVGASAQETQAAQLLLQLPLLPPGLLHAGTEALTLVAARLLLLLLVVVVAAAAEAQQAWPLRQAP